jgi:hypothetical protein
VAVCMTRQLSTTSCAAKRAHHSKREQCGTFEIPAFLLHNASKQAQPVVIHTHRTGSLTVSMSVVQVLDYLRF